MTRIVLRCIVRGCTSRHCQIMKARGRGRQMRIKFAWHSGHGFPSSLDTPQAEVVATATGESWLAENGRTNWADHAPSPTLPQSLPVQRSLELVLRRHCTRTQTTGIPHRAGTGTQSAECTATITWKIIPWKVLLSSRYCWYHG